MYEEARWMLQSIRILLQARDGYGAFAMCLLAMEVIASKRHPDITGLGKNRRRFMKFFSEERQQFSPRKVTVLNPKDPGPPPPDLDGLSGEQQTEAMDAYAAEMVNHGISIEEVLWEYCRCPIVHEGSRLSVGSGAEVAMDWSVPETTMFFQIDRNKENVIVAGARYWLAFMYRVVQKYLDSPASTTAA